jgi:TolB-like protein/Tfp pilus assembly protein PilF
VTEPDPGTWSRFRRSHLGGALVVYLGVAWVVLQVVETLGGLIALPSWVGPIALGLLAIGLVVVVATAWVQGGPGERQRADAEEVPDAWELDLDELGDELGQGRLPHLTWARAALGGVIAFSLLFGIAGLVVVIQGERPELLDPMFSDMSTVPSVAVLPFGFSGPNEEESYLADQITMKIIGSLSRSGARTPGWASVRPYRDSSVSAGELGRELGVDFVLQGTLLQIGDRLELIVELAGTGESFLLWSETYEGVARDLSGFEVAIAQTAIDSVSSHMGLGLGRLQVRSYTDDPVADSLYTRALYLANMKYDPLHTDSVFELTASAIARDSGFALAYVLNAFALMGKARVYWELPAGTAMPEARRLLERALEIDGELAEVYEGLGWYYYAYEWDWPAALLNFREAIRLQPTASIAWIARAFPLLATGRTEEAIHDIREAVRIDPHNPLVGSTECWILHLAGRYREAVASCDRVLEEIDPAHPVSLAIRTTARTFALAEQSTPGAREELTAAIEQLFEQFPLPPVEERLLWGEFGPGVFLAMAGDTARARAVIAEEKSRPDVRPLRIANQHAAIAEMDSAFAWLDRAIEARDAYLPEIRVRPEMANFRADPRYEEVLDRIGLER